MKTYKIRVIVLTAIGLFFSQGSLVYASNVCTLSYGNMGVENIQISDSYAVVTRTECYNTSSLEYDYGVDLMVSPSKFYTEEFLRKSMLYNGEVLETAVSRTDSLFKNNEEKNTIKENLGIPLNKKVLLYAPTYRTSGNFELPFNPNKLLEKLNSKGKDEWILVVKLHYLNKLSNVTFCTALIDFSRSARFLLSIKCLAIFSSFTS